MEQFVSDIARGVAGSAGVALEAFNAFFFALLMAAPAVAWMAYLPVERWLGIVARSHVAGVIAGTSLALLASICFAMLSRFLQGWVVSGYRWELYAPYAALVLVLVAIGVQVSAWSSFSSQRAVGLFAAALTLIVLVGVLRLM